MPRPDLGWVQPEAGEHARDPPDLAAVHADGARSTRCIVTRTRHAQRARCTHAVPRALGTCAHGGAVWWARHARGPPRPVAERARLTRSAPNPAARVLEGARRAGRAASTAIDCCEGARIATHARRMVVARHAAGRAGLIAGRAVRVHDQGSTARSAGGRVRREVVCERAADALRGALQEGDEARWAGLARRQRSASRLRTERARRAGCALRGRRQPSGGAVRPRRAVHALRRRFHP